MRSCPGNQVVFAKKFTECLWLLVQTNRLDRPIPPLIRQLMANDKEKTMPYKSAWLMHIPETSLFAA